MKKDLVEKWGKKMVKYQDILDQKPQVWPLFPGLKALAKRLLISKQLLFMALFSIPDSSSRTDLKKIFIEIIQNHKVHPFKVYNSMVLYIHRVVQPPPKSKLRTFLLSQKVPPTQQQLLLFPPPGPQAQATTNFLRAKNFKSDFLL